MSSLLRIARMISKGVQRQAQERLGREVSFALCHGVVIAELGAEGPEDESMLEWGDRLVGLVVDLASGATPRLCPGCRALDGEHDFGAGCTLREGEGKP